MEALTVCCLFTSFYGHPEALKRNSNWDLLSMLKPKNDEAWFCVGDFNEINC